MTATVTAIIPCFNHGAFLAECIASLKAQTVTTWRAIVLDDASTDGNYAKLQELAARFPVILLKNEIRQGIVKTLNRCYAECAEADYFYALASDDTMQP